MSKHKLQELTTPFEEHMETHIHFEMIVDGKYVNPKDYII